ncbi:hypothetical protein BDP55DRAFT_639285 [Colletotrichum godetiae]|uniref:Uncharacterized protein n=1 Tax=Colletotrichum godetiae TaxID=1209918 RepID=A0AAJ0A5D4_9PEZI|nr:uncharacterized protein BDP55DRAFT_639285 [Colletotrichum godetiae]KAK1656829.1 hypothetical protein BDP55DRAFT_639285 [Colletotrichum godetiae]
MSRDGIMAVLSAEKVSSKLSNLRKLFVSNCLVLVPMPAGRNGYRENPGSSSILQVPTPPHGFDADSFSLSLVSSMRNPSFGGVVRFQPLLSQRKGVLGHGAMGGYVLHKKSKRTWVAEKTDFERWVFSLQFSTEIATKKGKAAQVAHGYGGIS